LLPPGELSDLAERQRRWAHLAERHLDLEALWPLLQSPSPLPGERDPIDWRLAQTQASPGAGRGASPQPLPIAVASDAAFHFRYPEANEMLRALGLEPLPWSPLADDPLPDGCRAVLLPGGYPELHAAQLAASGRSLQALRTAAKQGLPIAAECGGLLLLGRELQDPEGIPHAMAGLLPFSAARGALSLGYRQATAWRDGLLVRRGETLWAHEFHRWQLLPDGGKGLINYCDFASEPLLELGNRANLWQVEGWGVPTTCEGWTTTTVHASWLHLHWAGCPEIPLRLAAASALVVPLPRNATSCPPRTPAPAAPVSVGG
jgi:cobyrinic acid a,c-diamide synthase